METQKHITERRNSNV